MSQSINKLSNSPQITGGDQSANQLNNINASGNSTVSVHQQVMNGYTFEQHTQVLKDQEIRIRADLERAHNAEEALLQKKLETIEAELSDIHVSYQKRILELERQIRHLEQYQSLFSAEVYNQARLALYSGNFSLAEGLYSTIEDQATGLVADAALQRGLIANQELRWNDALKHFRKAFALDPENDDYAFELAEMLMQVGLYLEAKNIYLERLDKFEGSENADELIKFAFFSEGLGLIYRHLGKYDDAQALYNRCLDLCEKILGNTHIALAKTYSDYAGLQSDLGNFNEAEKLFKKSLDVYFLNNRADSSYTATINANLANLYQEIGRLKEAESLFNETIPILQKHFGDHHPFLAKAYNNLGQLYFKQNRFDDAERGYNAAYLIFREILSPEHPDMIMVNLNLAGVFREQRKYADSKGLYESVINSLKLKFGEIHPTLATAYNNFSLLHFRQGKYTEAEALLKKSIEIGISSVGEYHADMIERYEALALIYQVQSRISEANKYRQLAQQIRNQNKKK